MIEIELREQLRDLFDKTFTIPTLDWQLRIELKNQILEQLREQFRWQFTQKLKEALHQSRNQ